MTSNDAAMANLPDDMNALVRAVTSMSTALEEKIAQFPRNVEGAVPEELLRTSTKLAIIHAGNAVEAALNQSGVELKWARAKVLSWAAAEAEWIASNAS